MPIRTALAVTLLTVATTTHAADSTLTRAEAKKQKLMEICLGENTAVGDMAKTNREEFPEMYQRRRAMCNQWIEKMPTQAKPADPSPAPATK